MSPIVARIPDGPPGVDEFIFHSGSLPEPPPEIVTDRILFRKTSHDYDGCFLADALWMYLSPQTCRQLGTLLLACCFHGPGRDIKLSIARPDSAIRRIIIRQSGLNIEDPPSGLSMAPFALSYFPAETRKHPFLYDRDIWDMPVLALSNADDCVGVTREDWENRDTVWMPPSVGTIRLGELLLNAGCSWNPVREYQLEGDGGYRGVGRLSAELRIFLPGSDGWIFCPDEEIPTAPVTW